MVKYHIPLILELLEVLNLFIYHRHIIYLSEFDKVTHFTFNVVIRTLRVIDQWFVFTENVKTESSWCIIHIVKN